MIFIPIITLIADFYLIFNISTVFFGYITAKYWKDKELVIKNLDVFWHFVNPFYGVEKFNIRNSKQGFIIFKSLLECKGKAV